MVEEQRYGLASRWVDFDVEMAVCKYSSLLEVRSHIPCELLICHGDFQEMVSTLFEVRAINV